MRFNQPFESVEQLLRRIEYTVSSVDFNAIKKKANSIVLSGIIAATPAGIDFFGRALSNEASYWGTAFVDTVASQTGLLMLGVGLVVSTMNDDITSNRFNGREHSPTINKLCLSYVLFCTILFAILSSHREAAPASWNCHLATLLVSSFLVGLALSIYCRVTRNLA